MDKSFNSLEELHKYYSQKNKCALKETATQPVYETVLPKSGLVFVGEAPGKDEDLKGRPFVGAAGKFLNDLLESIGYSREDVYVTNIVKYRPPSNRDPSEQEKESCRKWLNDELLFIKPKMIITLGRHALAKFVLSAVISKSHGKIFIHKSGLPIFVMYHPAVALYNGSFRDVLFNDMQNLKKFLEKDDELGKQDKQLEMF